MRTIVWFRGKDLRVGDHEPLARAAAEGEVIPLFVLEPRFFGPGRARRAPHRIQFLLESLAGLQEGLSERGSGLVLLKGPSTSALPRVASRWKVDRVWAHRGSEPGGRARDIEVASALDVPLRLFEGETLAPPGSIRTRAGRPFSVFTPFKRAFLKEAFAGRPRPAPEPAAAACGGFSAARPASTRLAATAWTWGRPATSRQISSSAPFRCGRSGTGHGTTFGTPRRARRSGINSCGGSSATTPCGTAQRCWSVPSGTTSSEFDEQLWTAWTEGRTGFPLVDASARQLLREGWVPNRARMVSASFLTKHLLIDYRLGEAHYLKYLVDGDPAQNNLGWQWSAGCGCDAQPWFRVFNPVLQGVRFDPSGGYVRRWVPRLDRLPNRYIHRPWAAPAQVLEEAGVRLGLDYPFPVVDHTSARERFLRVARNYLRGRGGDAGG